MAADWRQPDMQRLTARLGFVLNYEAELARDHDSGSDTSLSSRSLLPMLRVVQEEFIRHVCSLVMDVPRYKAPHRLSEILVRACLTSNLFCTRLATQNVSIPGRLGRPSSFITILLAPKEASFHPMIGGCEPSNDVMLHQVALRSRVKRALDIPSTIAQTLCL